MRCALPDREDVCLRVVSNPIVAPNRASKRLVE
jgi:hypothetical protein